MYADNYPIEYHLPGDNESPKFYGYVSEEKAGRSFIFLKELGVVKDYELTFCVSEGTEEFILSPDEFVTFIDLFIQDLYLNGYKPRKSWLDFMNVLKTTKYQKVIEWS